MYDIANDKLITTIGGEWSSTLWPIADYYPIGINVYPADQTSDGKARYMAIRWASNSESSGTSSSSAFMWGIDGSGITSTDQDAFNGRENTDKALLLADGTSANTQAAFAAFYACNIFAPSGTTAGDWYLPSKKELSMYSENYDTINAQLTLLKNAGVVSTVAYSQWSSTETDSTHSIYKHNNNSYLMQDLRFHLEGVRAMISI